MLLRCEYYLVMVESASSSPRDSMPGEPLPPAARRHPLVAEVRKRVAGPCGLERGTVAAAVSGGADSVALLLALHVMTEQSEGALNVAAVHVQHHLRDDAEDDAAFVKNLCAHLGVQHLRRDVNPAGEAGNLAEAARQMRYDALTEAANAIGASVVATAHHAEDQFETMLMALGRGAGLDGLSGMPWRRPLSGKVALVRPLLTSRKADCESLCRAAGIEWHEDPSNRDVDRTRARLRTNVLPVMESIWPDCARRAVATSDLLRAMNDLLEAHLEEVFGPAERTEWPRAAISREPVPIIAAGLRRAAWAMDDGVREHLTQRHLRPAAEAVADDVVRPRTFDLGRDLKIEITAHDVRLDSTDD